MQKSALTKALSVAAVVVAVAGLTAYLAGVFNNGGGPQPNPTPAGDGGIDVSNTPCEGIGAAREAVNSELAERKEAAETKYSDDMEAASDAYWETYRNLETTKWDCETDALLADPCKDLFERSSALAKEILDNIDQGFDEAKAAEREQVKKDYDDCMENPPEEKTYEGKKAKCEADFNAGVAAARETRTASEAAAAAARDAAITRAEEQHTSKHATITAIEEQCNIPPPQINVNTGGITTGGTGTVIQSGNPACTGNFTGYDPETQAEISRLTQLFNQARVGGKTSGIGGTNALSAKITQLRTEMAAGPRKCESDAFCGDPEPVCCSEMEVGKVACADGVCTAEKTECEEPEFCAGEPAECVSPGEGVKSEPVEISSVRVMNSLCISTIRLLDLQPKTEASDRFEITGNIPDWLSFSSVGGKMPQQVKINIDCATLDGMGPGYYTANGLITVFDQENNLINSIFG